MTRREAEVSYWVTRRESCVACGGTGLHPDIMTEDSWSAVKMRSNTIPVVASVDGIRFCPDCGGFGRREMQVPLMEALQETILKKGESNE